MKKIMFITATLLVSVTAFASLESKCGKDLADRYNEASDKLVHARINRMVSPAIGHTLASYLDGVIVRTLANPDLQTDETRCNLIEDAVSNIEDSLKEVGNDTIIQKMCNNFTH